MNNIDVLSLIQGAVDYSVSYEVVKHTDSEIKSEEIVIQESYTVVEAISFGQRSLMAEDIIEYFDDDLSWL